MSDLIFRLLLVSADQALVDRIAPVLCAYPAHLVTVATVEAGLAELAAGSSNPLYMPELVLVDERLPGLELNRLLLSTLAEGCQVPVPVLLLSATLPQWSEPEGHQLLSDIIPLDATPDLLKTRLTRALACHSAQRELEKLRTAVALDARHDALTGTLSRNSLLAALFTETDRVQRMGTPLCLILFDVDDFGHWNSRLGTAACDDLLVEVTGRVRRLLRSYDLLGRMGSDSFLAVLPGCGTANAVMLAERIRSEGFTQPFHVAGKAVRLSACFAVGASQGRTPIVVLRELENALRRARQAGPETIESAHGCPEAAPVEFFSPTTGEDLLAW